MPDKMKHCPAEELFDYIVKRVLDFASGIGRCGAPGVHTACLTSLQFLLPPQQGPREAALTPPSQLSAQSHIHSICADSWQASCMIAFALHAQSDHARASMEFSKLALKLAQRP